MSAACCSRPSRSWRSISWRRSSTLFTLGFFGWLCLWDGRLGGRSLVRAALGGALWGALVVFAGVARCATAAAVAAADELEVLDDHVELGALAASLLVLPLIVLEAALDKD